MDELILCDQGQLRHDVEDGLHTEMLDGMEVAEEEAPLHSLSQRVKCTVLKKNNNISSNVEKPSFSKRFYQTET